MATTRTLAELRTDARQYADMEGSSFVSDSEVTRRVNESNRRLYGRLSELGLAEVYFSTLASGNTSANSATYTLPTDVWKLAGVDVELGGYWQAAERIQWRDRNNFQLGYVWARYSDVYYAVHGMAGSAPTLEFFPTPTEAIPVRVYYIPEAATLVLDADTVSYPNGWESWIALDVAIQLLAKEESDTSQLMAQRDQIGMQITSEGGSVDRMAIRRVSDSRGQRAARSFRDRWYGA